MARFTHHSWYKKHKKILLRTVKSARFARIYSITAVALLGLTTVYWSIIGALIESSNADQLANTFLLDNKQTIAGAVLPTQHTFLLKTPLFWLVSLFSSSAAAFTIATVVLSLITVAGFLYILWRIERRPIVIGSLALALAATLLYIPAQSYPGSLLPANFTMLTTRNIEYILFIGILILFIKVQRLRSIAFLSGCVGAILLFASDRLFVSLGLGTAIIALIVLFTTKRRQLIALPIRIGIGMIVGYIGAVIAIFGLTAVGLHFSGGSSTGPYGVTSSLKQFILAVFYGLYEITTNFGANPGYDANVITTVPVHILSGLISPAGLGYVVTIGILVVIVRAIIGSIKTARTAKIPKRRKPIEWQSALPFILFATSISAFIVFIASNHYYPADSRYLTIFLFTGFITLAAAYRKTRFKPQRIVVLGIICTLGIIFGVVFQLQNLSAQHKVLATTESQNETIADILKAHSVATLVGNYWRVLPIRLMSPTLNVTPLDSCTSVRQTLSSSAWQPNLHTSSFAYLLQLNSGIADTPGCSLSQVTNAFGRPDSSVVVAGSRARPSEVLLFYDQGTHFLSGGSKTTTADTVAPISVDSMPFTTCLSTTIMQVVAHQDDDILFMNPDLTHAIHDGNCVRTVYVTAGDAGENQAYWLGRQHGAEVAYNTILGTPGRPWTERIVALDSQHTVTIANPRGNHAISLIFMHLPDGNMEGKGFASTHYQSLRKLYTRSIPVMNPVDDTTTSYTYGDLTTTLTHLMDVYKPVSVRTQSTFTGTTVKDHSDHNTVGEFTSLAFKPYQQANPNATLTYYLGYPIHTLPPNVSGDDFSQKVSTFLAFSQYDPATCHTLTTCNTNSVYGLYLTRQYTAAY